MDLPEESGSCISESLDVVESRGPAVDGRGLASTASVGCSSLTLTALVSSIPLSIWEVEGSSATLMGSGDSELGSRATLRLPWGPEEEEEATSSVLRNLAEECEGASWYVTPFWSVTWLVLKLLDARVGILVSIPAAMEVDT